MDKQQQIRFKIFTLLFMIFSNFSCRKTLTLPSTHLVPINQMWQTKNDARAAVFATYGLMRAALANNNAYLVYGELRGGDFQSVSNTDLKAIINNNLNATSPKMEEYKTWRRFYAVITQANLCLNNLAIVQENDFRYKDDELKLDIANVRFVRALAYFYLARIWGDVPFVTTLSYDGFKELPRTNKDTILDFALRETQKALKHLPWQYNGEFPEQKGKYWSQDASFWKGKVASKSAAYALLAHIAAWRSNYLDVIKYTGEITKNKALGNVDYSYTSTLTSTTGGVFMGQSDDIIFFLSSYGEFQESSSTGHIETWTMAQPYISRETPVIYVPNDTITGVFNEMNDERFSLDTIGNSFGDYFTGFGNPIPVFSKIRLITTLGDNPLENYQSGIVVFRYEEIELLRAEAFYFMNKTDDALQWLNTERQQRGLSNFSSSGKDLGVAILRERRRELMGEGWRWFDLVRFNKVAEYTSLSMEDIQGGALVWPIAKDILNTNSNVQQNAFW